MPVASPLLRPDTLLYIYYIEGIIPAHLSFANDHFIGNWVEEDCSFLFFSQASKEEVLQLLEKFPTCRLQDEYTMTYADWQGGIVEPIRIGRFLLNPTWIKASPGPEDIAITIDSGVVFGNGLHATTQACLEAIEIACAGKKVQSMLDLGTGTGILSLIAAKLGCKRVIAVDFNYLAAKTAQRNVVLNNLEDRVVVVNGKAEEQTHIASDLLVANIHYQVMEKLIRTPGFQRQKWFVLSGLLASEMVKVDDYLKQQPVLILKRWCQDNIWHTVLGITKG